MNIDVLTDLDLHASLRAAIERGAGAAVLAAEARCSVQFVYAVYAVYDGTKGMTPGIAKALGFRRKTVFVADPAASNGRVFDVGERPKRGRRKKVS